MLNFLVLVDIDALINEVKWSEPRELFYHSKNNLFNIFSMDSKKNIAESFSSSSNSEDVIVTEKLFVKSGELLPAKLHIIKCRHLFIVYGYQISISPDDAFQFSSMSFVNNFLRLFKDLILKTDFISQESSRYQFEQIQSINNELINTRRQLEKANANVRLANQDLNNKLVKDALTGLVSRYQFRAEMENLISKSPGSLGIFAFIDIDNFKKVNDTYGHAAGDSYLVEFANRLDSISMCESIKMRISGDEFGIFIYNISHEIDYEMDRLWEEIKTKVIHSTIKIGENEMQISVSSGMAVYGIDTVEIFKIVEYADFAMYKAKQKGKNCFAKFIFKEYEFEKGMTN